MTVIPGLNLPVIQGLLDAVSSAPVSRGLGDFGRRVVRELVATFPNAGFDHTKGVQPRLVSAFWSHRPVGTLESGAVGRAVLGFDLPVSGVLARLAENCPTNEMLTCALGAT